MSKPKAAKAPRAPSAQQKRGPARTLPWDPVLDAWAAGSDGPAIAKALDITPAQVRRVVHQARATHKDPRALRRRAPHGQPGTGSRIGHGWVPYWADPRQLPLPLPLAEAEASGAARAP